MFIRVQITCKNLYFMFITQHLELYQPLVINELKIYQVLNNIVTQDHVTIRLMRYHENCCLHQLISLGKTGFFMSLCFKSQTLLMALRTYCTKLQDFSHLFVKIIYI